MNEQKFSWDTKLQRIYTQEGDLPEITFFTDGKAWFEVGIGPGIVLRLTRHHGQYFSYIRFYVIEDHGFSELTQGVIGKFWCITILSHKKG